MKLLKSIIKEELRRIDYNTGVISELKVDDPALQDQVRRFAMLSDKIDKVDAEMKALKKEYSALEGILTPILEELKDAKENALEVDDILVTIKTRGYTSTAYSYKDAYSWLKERVNKKMQELVDAALEETKTLKTYATKLAVQKVKPGKVNENIFGKLLSKLKSIGQSLLSKIRNTNKTLSKDIIDFKKKLASSKNESFNRVSGYALRESLSSSSIDDPSNTIKVVSGEIPDWLKRAKFKNAEITIQYGRVIWDFGHWISGVWRGGLWKGGIWEDGIWESGTFTGGTWRSGTWKSGTFQRSTWQGGNWMTGSWYGGVWGGGIWHDGTWHSGIWIRGTWKGGIWGSGKWIRGKWEGGIWPGEYPPPS